MYEMLMRMKPEPSPFAINSFNSAGTFDNLTGWAQFYL